MKKLKSILAMVFACQSVFAQNPIIQTVYTADPAPMVYKDTLFLYTGHDEDDATEDRFVMKDYLLFSTTDMVNWTHHGQVLSTEWFGWTAPLNANAAQVTFRNGKFYFYLSPWSALTDKGDCIAVAVSDSPFGPFKDALGKPLINPGQTTYSGHLWEDLDPTVLIDNDGQAYLYWGNNALYCVKLNKDMISYSGKIITFDIKNKNEFGPDYEEAPWLFKRNNTYYLLYAAHIPEAIYYATSSKPTGPWKYGGIVMRAMAQGSIGNHPAAIEFKGEWFFFYMNQDLPGGHSKRRAVNVIPFKFNPDGSIPELKHSKQGVLKPLKNLNPYQRVEAETIAWAEGVKTYGTRKTNVYVTKINNGDYIKVRSVDFGKGPDKFSACIASATGGSQIEVRIDSVDGPLIAVIKVDNTGGWENWIVRSSKTEQVKGIHDVYFVFKGGDGDLFNFDWWRFE